MATKCPSCDSKNTGTLHDSDKLDSDGIFYCNNCDEEFKRD